MTTTIYTVRRKMMTLRKTMTLRRAHSNLATRLFSAGLVLVVASTRTRLTTGTEGHTIIPEVDSAERCGGFVATFETYTYG